MGIIPIIRWGTSFSISPLCFTSPTKNVHTITKDHIVISLMNMIIMIRKHNQEENDWKILNPLSFFNLLGAVFY